MHALARRLPVVVLLLFVPLLSWSGTTSEDTDNRALKAIRLTAKDICSTAPLTNRENKVELSADAQANFAGLLKKLTDLGAAGAAKYSSSESEAGLLRADIVAALKDQNSCRLEVFHTLVAKLLASEAPAAPSANRAASSAQPTRTKSPPGKVSLKSDAPRPQVKKLSNAAPEERPQPEIESVDFLRDKPEITDRSSAYLSNLAKRLASFPDARVTLVPQYQTELEYQQDNLAEEDSSLRLRRQIAVRNALVASGFPSDNIFMPQGSASISNEGIRLDGKGRRIVRGMMVQAWP